MHYIIARLLGLAHGLGYSTGILRLAWILGYPDTWILDLAWLLGLR